jgi:hypothetical protein
MAGNFLTAPGAVNPVATLNANLYITGVALMVGSAAQNAEPEFRKYADNLIDCCRYYQRGAFGLQGFGGATAVTVGYEQSLLTSMRAAPTITPTESSAVGMSTRSITVDDPAHIRPSGTAANAFSWLGTFTADADF